jgi:hypothetical protein
MKVFQISINEQYDQIAQFSSIKGIQTRRGNILFDPVKNMFFIIFNFELLRKISEHQTSRKCFCGGFEDHLQISTWEDGFRIIKDRYEIT